MQPCFDALIYILTSLLSSLKAVYIVDRVTPLRFFLAIPLFGIVLKYLVKVPSYSLGGLKRSYDRKLSRQSTPKK